MATSLTKKGLVAASDKVIVAARPALELIKNFTTDFSADAIKVGNGIAVDVLSATAETFVKTTNNYKHATGTVKNVLVPCSTHKKATFSLDDLDVLEDETAHLWDKFGPVAGRAVGGALVSAVTGLLTYTARESSTFTLAGDALANFFALKGMIDAQGVASETCCLILEPSKYTALCAALGYTAVGTGMVIDGAEIGARLGFKAICNGPTISKTSASGVNKGVGFVVPENAIAIANRIVKPLKGATGETLEYGTITDELTGFNFSTRVVADGGDGEAFWTTEGLFGAKLTKLDASGNATGAPGFYQVVTA